MRDYSDPRVAVVSLVLLGAVLNIIEGIVVIGITAAFVPLVSVATNLVGFGVVEIFLGLILVALSWFYYSYPEFHLALGTVMIVVASFSLPFGGGFGAGLILTLTGGIFAVALSHEHAITATVPSSTTADFYPSKAKNESVLGPARGPEVSTSVFDWSTIVRFCLTCGARNPTAAAVCSTCGAPLKARTA